jgi:hypothetical protein
MALGFPKENLEPSFQCRLKPTGMLGFHSRRAGLLLNGSLDTKDESVISWPLPRNSNDQALGAVF